MNFKDLPPLKRGFVILLLTVGGVLSIRLVLMAALPWRTGKPESMEEFRAKMTKASQFEREQSERLWIESGKPLPPGGFDELWRRAHGLAPGEKPHESDSELLEKERQNYGSPTSCLNFVSRW